MHRQRRQRYLQALGIEGWRLRAAAHAPAESDAEPQAAAARSDDGRGKAPETPRPDSIANPSGDTAGLDWDGLAARIRACTRCELHRGRTQAVVGAGVRAADLMVVGEGPGAEEDRRGEAFVGRAGRLLDEMLLAIGCSRTGSVFIANIVKCRPPGNRDPRPEEVAACEGYLRRQIDLVKPRVIAAVGRVAAQNLLGTQERLGAMRGREYEYQGTPVIVTYHPAYLLRSPQDKRKAWADLKRVRARLEAGR